MASGIFPLSINLFDSSLAKTGPDQPSYIVVWFDSIYNKWYWPVTLKWCMQSDFFFAAQYFSIISRCEEIYFIKYRQFIFILMLIFIDLPILPFKHKIE